MELSPIFASNMVFAANQAILIYGTGRGTAQICFAGQTKTVVSGETQWCVEFPPMKYGGPYELTFTLGEEKICLNNTHPKRKHHLAKRVAQALESFLEN